MKLSPFVYAPMRRFGELVKRHDEEVTDAPAPDYGPDAARGTDGLDAFGALWRGGRLVGEGRFLYRLEDVTVIRGGPLGPNAWHIMAEPNVAMLEASPRGQRDLAGTEGITFTLPDGNVVGVNVVPAHDGVIREDRPAIFYASDFDNNHYHRVFDLLPRTWAEAEGLTPEGAIWHRKEPAVRYRELWFPSTWPSMGYSPSQVRVARERRPEATSDAPVDVLWLTRSDMRRRRLLNEDAVIEALRRYWRVTVANARGMTLVEQVAAAMDARVIAGPHGAALANLAWPDRCAVVELAPEGYLHPCFQYHAKWVGHWYGRVVCPSGEYDQITADPEAVSTAIEAAMAAL